MYHSPSLTEDLSPAWIHRVFEINVRGNCEKCIQSLHMVLSHHLKPCRYLQRSIDLPSLLDGPELYGVLIDYVDSLCGVRMSRPCPDIRPWQQFHVFMWRQLLLWISKLASGKPETSCREIQEVKKGLYLWTEIPSHELIYQRWQ